MRPIDEPLTGDDRFAEVARILAAGVLRLRTSTDSPPSPEHDPASENTRNSHPHALEPRPRQSLIHHAG